MSGQSESIEASAVDSPTRSEITDTTTSPDTPASDQSDEVIRFCIKYMEFYRLVVEQDHDVQQRIRLLKKRSCLKMKLLAKSKI